MGMVGLPRGKPGPGRAMEVAKISRGWEGSRGREGHVSKSSLLSLLSWTESIKGEDLGGAARTRATWQEAGSLRGGDEEVWEHPGSEVQQDYGICQKSLRAPQRWESGGKCSLTPRDVWKTALLLNSVVHLLDIYPKEVDIWSKLYEQRSSS